MLRCALAATSSCTVVTDSQYCVTGATRILRFLTLHSSGQITVGSPASWKRFAFSHNAVNHDLWTALESRIQAIHDNGGAFSTVKVKGTHHESDRRGNLAADRGADAAMLPRGEVTGFSGRCSPRLEAT